MDEESFKAELRELHDRLGFTLGWDFAMTPMSKLANAETILVGLNPGGTTYADSWENLDGNDYFIGDWEGPIRTQVKLLHELLDIDPNEIFAAQYFPFRSKKRSDIKGLKYNCGMKFSNTLWTWILRQTKARRFICMGADSTEQIAKLLNISLDNKEEFLTGWARGTKSPEQKIVRHVSNDGKYVLVNWPHPGRYKIFTQSNLEHRQLAMESMRKAARLD